MMEAIKANNKTGETGCFTVRLEGLPVVSLVMNFPTPIYCLMSDACGLMSIFTMILGAQWEKLIRKIEKWKSLNLSPIKIFSSGEKSS